MRCTVGPSYTAFKNVRTNIYDYDMTYNINIMMYVKGKHIRKVCCPLTYKIPFSSLLLVMGKTILAMAVRLSVVRENIFG